MIKIFSPKEVAFLRRPEYSSFQGWMLEDKVSSGRATCRCCGQKIAKGVVADTVYIDLSVPVMNSSWNGNGWKATQIWMHKDCQPVMVDE